jgi:integrase/recombinase XerC
MTDLPAPIDGPHLPAPAVTVDQLYDAFLSGRKATTKKAYERDLKSFATFLQSSDARAATAGFFQLDAGPAHYQVDRWVAAMKERGLKASTINRRLSALRSMANMAMTYGVTSWSLKTKNERTQDGDERDMSGPDLDTIRRLLDHCDGKVPTMASMRNAAIVRLLYGHALRRFEVTSLDLEDVDFEKNRLRILGKGRTARSYISMSPSVATALKNWVAARGREPGALFTSFDPAKKGDGRLDGSSVRRIVKKLGAEIGIELWPHALRHSSITSALDHTDGDVRRVMRFSRHKNVNTLMKYDDKRKDDAGDIADLVDEGLDGE